MGSSTSFWLVIGTPENWHIAFDYGAIWGLKLSQHRYWDMLVENSDLVFFYVTSPLSGVIGYGIVRTKLHQHSPLWPAERARNELIWPLRFEFDVLACLPPSAWENQRWASKELKRRARSGFQHLEPRIAEEILSAFSAPARSKLTPGEPVGLRARTFLMGAATTQTLPADPHDRTQSLLAEIGRIQRLLADTEYPLENRRLDVVWRRVQRSVPSFVFEVQIAGNLTEAMGKLKLAHDLWNSNIFLVGKEEHHPAALQLAGGAFHEIQEKFRFLELSQVEELYQRKRAYRDLENQLGILS